MPHIDFDKFEEEAGLVDILDQNKTVPNQFPTLPFNGIAIIGEAPGRDEVSLGKPFMGMAGKFLNALLSKHNILRDACFIGNICQYQAYKNDFATLTESQIDSGRTQLFSDLETIQPTICLLLGNAALHYFRYENHPPKRKKGAGSTLVFTDSISNWRGSLFFARNTKCLSSYHPAACLRNYSWTPLLIFDIGKVAKEAKTKELILPQRSLETNLSCPDICNRLYAIKAQKLPVAIDIEGGINSMSCISFATSPFNAFIVPLAKHSGENYWFYEDAELDIWQALVAVLTDPQVPKVLQNSLYDRFVLMYSYHIIVRGVIDDTMLKHWEWNCELEKSLGFMCSIHTKEPYYKEERHSENQETFYEYCCKDSATTFEINQRLSPCLTAEGRSHYQLNLDLLNPLLYLQQRGLRYNHTLAKQRVEELSTLVFPYQYKLDMLARKEGLDFGLTSNATSEQLLNEIYATTGYKNNKYQPKSDFVSRGYYGLVESVKNNQPLTEELRGRINVMCKRSLNVKSPDFKSFLYTTLKLPIQLHAQTKKPTTDYPALLKLTKKSDHPALRVAIDIARLRTRLQTLAIQPCADGRMRWSTNIVGSETGRITTSKSSINVGFKKKSGTNMQGIPDDWDMEDEDDPLSTGMRDLLQADEGWFFAKCDLKGADGWTVGAELAKLGDPTMLDDLKFGLKPAQIVCFILRHGSKSIQGKSRDELKILLQEVKKEDWDYYVCKQGIWGTCYTMGPRKLAERVFVESEGKVNLSESEARTFQGAVFVRYQVKKWHNSVQRLINDKPYPFALTSSVGHTRKFWGRKAEILGEVLAHLPQEYTTHATKLAARKIWTDPENTTSEWPPRRIEILHCVHDELDLHFRQTDLDWALAKIKWAFNNPMNISGQMITIPFDGAYGHDWALNESSKVGSIV